MWPIFYSVHYMYQYVSCEEPGEALYVPGLYEDHVPGLYADHVLRVPGIFDDYVPVLYDDHVLYVPGLYDDHVQDDEYSPPPREDPQQGTVSCTVSRIVHVQFLK